MSIVCYEYASPCGVSGKIMAYSKAHAILTIKELHPLVNLTTLLIFLEDMWTSLKH